MSWQDVYFNRTFTESEIASALSTLFNVQLEAVNIQLEKVDLSNTENIRVVCGVYKIKGDFPTILEIVPLETELIPVNKYDTIGWLCEALNAHALINYDLDDNPYSSTLVSKRGDYQKVELDADMLDDERGERIHIVKYLEKFTV